MPNVTDKPTAEQLAVMRTESYIAQLEQRNEALAEALMAVRGTAPYAAQRLGMLNRMVEIIDAALASNRSRTNESEG